MKRIVSHTSTTSTAGNLQIRKRASTQPEEYARFEELTRKLLSVPKSEVDKRRKKG